MSPVSQQVQPCLIAKGRTPEAGMPNHWSNPLTNCCERASVPISHHPMVGSAVARARNSA